MKWLKSLAHNLRKPKEPIFVGEQVPVNQSLEFSNHNLFIETYFSFLRKEFGISLPSSSWHSREYSTVYKNPYVEIRITFEIGTLPHACIRQEGGSTDAVCHLAVLDTERNMENLYAAHLSRLEPKRKRYIARVVKENIYDRREMDEDYRQWGQEEHEKILCLYANVIKKYPEILTGNFSRFSTPDSSA